MAVDSSWAGLLERIAQSDHTALERLYDVSSPLVFGLVLRIVRDRASAEEVVLEIYMEVWRAAPQFDRQRSAASAWLLMLARARAVDYPWLGVQPGRRCEQLLDTPLDEHRGVAPNSREISLQGGHGRIVQAALGARDPRQRKAINRVFLFRFRGRKIAVRLSGSLGAVTNSIRVGMLHLRERLRSGAEVL